MSSFLRKVVKEVQTIKNIIDIPSMKKHRDEIKTEIENLKKQLEITNEMLSNKGKFDNVINSCEDIKDIKGDELWDEMTNKLASYLLYLKEKMDNLQKEYIETNLKLEELNKELENINKAIDKARGK